jgi:molecular chaperone IbpA
MAVAGFSPDEIELVQQENTLLVTGQKHPDPQGAQSAQLLHRGIASGAFKQTFNVADHVKVTQASLQNGLLTIDLVREVPEALKPRRIEIAGGSEPRTVAEDDKAQIEHEPLRTTKAA